MSLVTTLPTSSLSKIQEEHIFKTQSVVVPDQEDIPYVGDEVVLARLEELACLVREGSCTEETKQAIYYYAEHFISIPGTEPSEYVKQVQDAAKYFFSGWWIHSLAAEEEGNDDFVPHFGSEKT